MIFELIEDYVDALEAMPSEHPRQPILNLLKTAVSRDVHFIDRHPTTMFQCMWNTCWWYDCKAASSHYHARHPEPGIIIDRGRAMLAPARRQRFAIPRVLGRFLWLCAHPFQYLRNAFLGDRRLCEVMQRWRAQKEKALPDFRWLRTRRPPAVHLGSAQLAVLHGHSGEVTSVAFSPDGDRIASGSYDETVRVWDAHNSALPAVMSGHENCVMSVAFSSNGDRIVSGSRDGILRRKRDVVRVWDAVSGDCLEVINDSFDVAALAAHTSGLPWRAVAQGRQTVIEDGTTHAIIARLPMRLEHIITHPNGPTLAGIDGHHLCITTLEGGEMP